MLINRIYTAKLLDNRGVSTVIGKIFEIGILTIVGSIFTAGFFVVVIPGVQTTIEIQQAEQIINIILQILYASIPPSSVAASIERSLNLPPLLGGSSYQLLVSNGSLILDHPDFAISRNIVQIGSDDNVRITGSTDSSAANFLRIEKAGDSLEVRLE